MGKNDFYIAIGELKTMNCITTKYNLAERNNTSCNLCALFAINEE